MDGKGREQGEWKPWVKLWRYESPDEKVEPLAVRSLRAYLHKICRQDSGILVQNCVSADKAVETLALACGAHPSEIGVTLEHVHHLIRVNFLALRERHKKWRIEITDWDESQHGRSKRAVYQANYRARKKAKAEQLPLPTAPSTERPPASSRSSTRDSTREVTRGHTGESRVFVRQDKTRSDKTRQDLYKGNGSGTGPAEHHMPSEHVSEWARNYLHDPTRAALDFGPPHTWPEMQEVVGYFNEVWDKRATLLSDRDPRTTVLLERFAEGYAIETLKSAIRGATHAEWIQTHGEAQCLKTILRDGSAIDKYAALDHAGGNGQHPSVQPAAGRYYDDMGWSSDTAPPPRLEASEMMDEHEASADVEEVGGQMR